MDYSNPEIPENINTTKGHPLKEFFLLAGGILGGIVVIVIILSLLADVLVPHIPFSVEQQLAAKFINPPQADDARQNYLQSLADDLVKGMDIPGDMSVTVHYAEDDVENAFATLGGHIFFHQGLLEMLPHENALAMVVAHEIAHVQHRHPLIAMGRGVAIGLFLATITGISGDRFTGTIISDTGMTAALSFNREQEREADRTALAAVNNRYGHVAGSNDLFKTLLKIERKHNFSTPQFLSTHPVSTKRIISNQKYAIRMGWKTQGETQLFPDIFNN